MIETKKTRSQTLKMQCWSKAGNEKRQRLILGKHQFREGKLNETITKTMTKTKTNRATGQDGKTNKWVMK